MAYDKELAIRISKVLSHLPDVEGKNMFGGRAFMVNGKMCLTAGPDRMMCRINPDILDQEVKRDGCSTVVMRGREYKGYIYIKAQFLESEQEFIHWIKLALEFNEELMSK